LVETVSINLVSLCERELQQDTDFSSGNLFKMAPNNNANLISDEELTQKRQDLHNKNTIKSENDANIKLGAYLKARRIENYEE
jgi:hypothetical protein